VVDDQYELHVLASKWLEAGFFARAQAENTSATYVLTVVDPADDAVVVGADGLSMKWPRPMVSGGAVVGAVPGLSAR
jgi:hypothetical protein